MKSKQIPAAAAALALALSLAAPTTAHALRVVKDSATGELRAPNAAEAAAFEAAEAQLRVDSRNGAVKGGPRITGIETRYPDGTVEMSLGEDTHLYSVVNTAADGSLQMDCVPAAEARKLMLTSKAAAPARTGIAAVTQGGAQGTSKGTNVHQ